MQRGIREEGQGFLLMRGCIEIGRDSMDLMRGRNYRGG
jgi:hypothetical protein